MATILNGVGFVGRDATEVAWAARQQRFNAGVVELRKDSGEGTVYVGKESGFFGYTVAFLKDKFFGLTRLKCFKEGDQKAAALFSFREQINELQVVNSEAKEKYLRELDFKIDRGLPLRASFYSKAVNELFATIGQPTENHGGGVGTVVPPEYEAVVTDARQEAVNDRIPGYEDVTSVNDWRHVNTNPAPRIRPVPYDYGGNPVTREDLQNIEVPPSAVDHDERRLFQLLDATPQTSAGGVPAYNEATGHAQQSVRVQEEVYQVVSCNERWKGLRHLHRPPVQSVTQENRSGIFEEHASRFDQVTGNAEDFYGHYLEPALREVGGLPQFGSEDARKDFAEGCLCLHKNNYLGMVAKRAQNQEGQHCALGYSDIRNFLEIDVCSATLAGVENRSPENTVDSLRQKVFQSQMAAAPDAAGIGRGENHAIKERLLEKFGLAGNQKAYHQACGLAAATNAYVLMSYTQGTSVDSRWFSANPPKIENFLRSVEEVIKFSELASAANDKAMNEDDLEIKIFKLLCDQSWKNYSGPEYGRRFIAEAPSEIMVDTALRLAWKECSCFGRKNIGNSNLPVANYLNIFGKGETRDYRSVLFDLYRSALLERVCDVSKESKSYELECLLQAGDLFTEIKTETAGLSLCDVREKFPVQFRRQVFRNDFYLPLRTAIGDNPADAMDSEEYMEDLAAKLQSLAPYAMAVAGKAPGVVDNTRDLPGVLREVLERELAKIILRDLGRSDQANDDAYLKEVCDQAFAAKRQDPILWVSDKNERQRVAALAALGIGENVDGNRETLLYLQHLSKIVILGKVMNSSYVDEEILDSLDILQLEGSEKFIENAINHWTAKKTAVGKHVSSEELQMQIFSKITELSWRQYRRELAVRGRNDGLENAVILPGNCYEALQSVAKSYTDLARRGSDAILARGPLSFFTYSVTENPFANRQEAYMSLRFGSANKIRKAWRDEMGSQLMDDDLRWGMSLYETLGFLLRGRVVLRKLLDDNLAAQAQTD